MPQHLFPKGTGPFVVLLCSHWPPGPAGPGKFHTLHGLLDMSPLLVCLSTIYACAGAYPVERPGKIYLKLPGPIPYQCMHRDQRQLVLSQRFQ